MELTLIQKISIWALPLIFAITLHEVAHGWVASFFGDQTARFTGRLSLNPLKHIDPMGTIIIPLLMMLLTNFIFGWAKPVPVDARNFKHPRRDLAVVAMAGPVSNLVMAVMWGAIGKLSLLFLSNGNAWLGMPLLYMAEAGVMLNVVLAILNLIPLPPLDGGKFLMTLLPPRIAYKMSFVEPYSFFILILLMVTGVLTFIIMPFVFFFVRVIGNMFGLP